MRTAMANTGITRAWGSLQQHSPCELSLSPQSFSSRHNELSLILSSIFGKRHPTRFVSLFFAYVMLKILLKLFNLIRRVGFTAVVQAFCRVVVPLSSWKQRRIVTDRYRSRFFTVQANSVSSVAMGEEDVKFLSLSDGRRIAYREEGLHKDAATKSLLVLHGLGSSRVAGMPGVSESLLKEMGVRLVSIDRPGYGASDFNSKQTFETAANDVAQIADILELGRKIWLLGYSCGGAYCWAAARYIPERIAGIAMWAPVGNYHWKGISETERNILMGNVTAKSRSIYGVVGKLPQWMLYAYVRFFIIPSVGAKWVDDAKQKLSPPDVKNLQEISGHMMERDSIESGKQKGKGMVQDLLTISSAWGFELSDVQDVYPGSIHIFQGDQDKLVPLGLQKCIKKVAPDLVHLHDLEGEGHLSAFCFNDKIHRETLECLFGGAGTMREMEASQLDTKGEAQNGSSSITDTLQAGASPLDAPYIH